MANGKDDWPEPDLCDISSLNVEHDRPLRPIPSEDAVQEMIRVLKRSGLQTVFIGTRDGDGVTIVDGRKQLLGLQRIHAEGGPDLPCGTELNRIPVYILTWPEAVLHVLQLETALSPPASGSRLRILQELEANSAVKDFYSRETIDRNGGQAAGPQHQAGWPRALSDRTGLSRPLVSRLLNIARNVPAAVVCEVMGTSEDRDTFFEKVSERIQRGEDPDRALEQVRGANRNGKGKAGSTPPPAERVVRNVETMAADDRQTYFAEMRAAMTPEVFRDARQAFRLEGHRGRGRQGKPATPAERHRVSRRLGYLFDRSPLDFRRKDVALLAGLGEATINELHRQDNRVSKIQETVDIVNRVLDRLKIPADPKHDG